MTTARLQLFHGDISPMSTVELARAVGVQQSIADLDNVRAILAIEQGDTVEAARIFKETLKEKRPSRTAAGGVAPLAASSAMSAAALVDAETRVHSPFPFPAATRPVALRYSTLLEANAK